jgi:hypothetical protein
VSKKPQRPPTDSKLHLLPAADRLRLLMLLLPSAAKAGRA